MATPEQIAAAWGAWRVRHKGSMGPGPGFVEAIDAALAVSPAATEIEALRRENQELREANRKLHRRAQLAERTHQMAIDVLTGWYDYLRSYCRNAPRKDRFLFRRAIGDMKCRAERFDRALTMPDIHREQLDRREAE
jgi:hypothetical protein